MSNKWFIVITEQTAKTILWPELPAVTTWRAQTFCLSSLCYGSPPTSMGKYFQFYNDDDDNDDNNFHRWETINPPPANHCCEIWGHWKRENNRKKKKVRISNGKIKWGSQKLSGRSVDRSGEGPIGAVGGALTGLNTDRCCARMENAEAGFSFESAGHCKRPLISIRSPRSRATDESPVRPLISSSCLLLLLLLLFRTGMPDRHIHIKALWALEMCSVLNRHHFLLSTCPQPKLETSIWTASPPPSPPPLKAPWITSSLNEPQAWRKAFFFLSFVIAHSVGTLSLCLLVLDLYFVFF